METLEIGPEWEHGFKIDVFCPHCASKFRLFLEDIKRNTDYDGSFDCWYWDCPICLEQPEIDKKLWGNIERLKRRDAI